MMRYPRQIEDQGYLLWKADPWYPKPYSPVHSARKFSAVFGTTSLKSLKTTLAGVPKVTHGQSEIEIRERGKLASVYCQVEVYGR